MLKNENTKIPKKIALTLPGELKKNCLDLLLTAFSSMATDLQEGKY